MNLGAWGYTFFRIITISQRIIQRTFPTPKYPNLPTLYYLTLPTIPKTTINTNYFQRFCSVFTRRGFLEEEEEEDAAVVAVER